MTVQKLWELASVQQKLIFCGNVNFMNTENLDEGEKWLGDFWNIVNEPMKDFITRTGLTVTEFAAQNNINIRTVRHWTAGERACPQYVRFAYAKLYNLIDVDYIKNVFCDF